MPCSTGGSVGFCCRSSIVYVSFISFYIVFLAQLAHQTKQIIYIYIEREIEDQQQSQLSHWQVNKADSLLLFFDMQLLSTQPTTMTGAVNHTNSLEGSIHFMSSDPARHPLFIPRPSMYMKIVLKYFASSTSCGAWRSGARTLRPQREHRRPAGWDPCPAPSLRGRRPSPGPGPSLAVAGRADGGDLGGRTGGTGGGVTRTVVF